MNNTEETVGRPSLYKPEYCRKLIEYFSVKPYEFDNNGKVVVSNFPTLAGFASKLRIHRETILNWTKVHPDFFDAYKLAKDLQEHFLVTNGIRGHLDTSFAIFTAKNVLGWRDKTEVEQKTNTVHSFSDNDKAVLKEFAEKASKFLDGDG